MSLPAPPIRDTDHTSTVWLAWYRKISEILSNAGTEWGIINKTGSNLTDLETRNHSGLQNILGSGAYHLSQTQHTDLTDAGNSALHYHDADRDRANHTGTQLLATISDAGNSSGLNVGTAAGTVAAGDDARFLTAGNKTDLTDGGDSTLHYHSADRDRANHSGTQNLSTISDAGDSAGLDVGTTAGTVAAGDDGRFPVVTPVAAAAVLDAANYISVVINGVTYKLALIV